MKKLVNGVEIELSPEEEAAILAQWDAAVAAKAADALVQAERTARKVALDGEAVSDVFIDRLRGATPDQIKTWCQDNLTMFTVQQRTVLARLAVAISYALNGGTSK
jgi:hypothetical protein